MKTITIDESLTSLLTKFSVSAYLIELEHNYNALIKSNNVTNLINDTINDVCKMYNYEDVCNITKLKIGRTAYKKLGKDPSHTRLASEALLRRCLKNKQLYRLGDCIDIGNILSIKTLKPVCICDYDKICGDILIRKGKSTDNYEGIGRGIINVSNIPIYVDSIAPFGSTTSDTIRTMVVSNTKRLLAMVISFSNDDVVCDEQLLTNLYTKYASIKDIKKISVIDNIKKN